MKQQLTEEHDEPAANAALPVHNQTEVESNAGIVEDRAEGRVEGQIDDTARLIEELSSSVRTRKRAFSRLPVPTVTISAALIAVRLLLFNSVTGIRPLYWMLFAAFLAGNTGLVALLFSGVTRLNRAIRALSGTDDVRAVGVMAESLTAGEPALSISSSVLIRLLPHTNSTHLVVLTPEQRSALRKGLQCASNRLKHTQYNPALVVAIIQAFERIGDKSDLAVVEKLASSRAITAEQKSIRTAARSCLSTLWPRIIGNTDAQLEVRDVTAVADMSLSTEAVETLSTRLRNIARIRRRNVAVTASGAVAGTGLAFLSLTTLSADHQLGPGLMAGMLSCLASMIYFALSGTYSQRNLTNALIHSDDLRIVAPLIQAAATVEISGTTAVMLLTRLLPRLRASDAHLLDVDDRTLLHTAIARHAGNREFVLAALSALQQTGDAASIPIVQKLAERTGRRAADPAIREAARECLEFLQQRAALTEANHTLLRSSSAAAAPTDTLLLALDGPAATSSDELLRTTSAPIVYDQSDNGDAHQSVQAFVLQPAR